MAGTSSDFNAADFRANIRATMTMGLSNVSNEQPTFVINPSSYIYPTGTLLDEQNKPYDLSIMATPVGAQQVKVPCAIEWGSGKAESYTVEPTGDFAAGDAVLTLLDVDYVLVQEADYVMMGDQKYEIRFLEPQIGLFDVSVYRLHIKAVQEHA